MRKESLEELLGIPISHHHMYIGFVGLLMFSFTVIILIMFLLICAMIG